MLESLNDWTSNLRNGNFTRVAYVDISKAFDSVCHSKLIYKLSKLSVSGNMLSVLTSFLHRRSQQVKVDGCLSSSVHINSGVI